MENQAIDRVHRLGQNHKVMVMRYVVRNTVEDMILELQARKKTVADTVMTVGRQDQDEGRLQLDDLLHFFQR